MLISLSIRMNQVVSHNTPHDHRNV